MKKTTLTKILCLLLAAVLLLPLCACTQEPAKTTAEKIAAGEKVRIGIIQYMRHPSLDNCYNGIKASLDASGIAYELDYQVGSDSAAYTDCTNFAQNMVASRCDMIIAIATPAATVALSAVADTSIPVIFCAVSDPVSAKLVDSLAVPGVNCTGTSDVLDLEAQVNLITAFQPNVKKIGILYTSSESNSLTNLANFRTVCEAKGIEVVAKPVQNASDIPDAAESLASSVDCINNFTDNNVVNNLAVVLNAANRYNIPVYGSEEEQVKNGCLASVSIDYVALGKVTGNMACDVLKGASASTMAVKTIQEATPIVNATVREALGYAMPAGYTDVTEVTGAQ